MLTEGQGKAILVPSTNFSIQFVLDKLCQAICSNGNTNACSQQLLARLDHFEAKDITGGNAFLSSVLRLNLHWREETTTAVNGESQMPSPMEGLPKSIIMKVPCPNLHLLNSVEGQDSYTEESNEFLITAHERELLFYKHFAPLEPSIGLRLPRFFYGASYHPSHREGLILMEDLSPRAAIIPMIPGLNEAQILEILDELAKVNVVSWKHPEWIDFVGSNPFSEEFIDMMKKNALHLKKIDSEHCGPLVDRLLPHFNVPNCELSNYISPKYGFPPCLVHADIWAPNMLWQMDERGRPTDRLAALIDWQCIHSGNPCEDILRLLALNTSAKYRRENEHRLLAYYAQKVNEYYGSQQNGPKSKQPLLTVEKLEDAYRHGFPCAMMYLCFGAAFYVDMDSVLGTEPTERKLKRAELLDRVSAFLEDTEKALLTF